MRNYTEEKKMRKYTLKRLVLVGLALLFMFVYAAADIQAIYDPETEEPLTEEKQPQYAPGQIIIKLKEAKSSKILSTKSYSRRISSNKALLNSLKNEYNLRDEKPVFKTLHKQLESKKLTKRNKIDLFPIYILETDENIFSTIEKLKKDPRIEYAQPNYKYEIAQTPLPDEDYIPNDYYLKDGTNWKEGSWGQDYPEVYPDLWGLQKIQAIEAYNVFDTNGNSIFDEGETQPGEGVVVAVIDTGVDYNHEDIGDNILRDPQTNEIIGYDFSGDNRVREPEETVPDDDPMDYQGHGTHCAGTIAAIGNNAVGIIGVAPKAKIMPVKIFPNAFDSVIVEGLYFAADNKADVLSNSWGPTAPRPSDPVLEDAVEYAYNREPKGCVIVFSAGNNNDDVKYYSPANHEDIIAVAASDPYDEKCQFSNYGDTIDVIAPGGLDNRGWERKRSVFAKDRSYRQTHWEGNYCVMDMERQGILGLSASFSLITVTGPDQGIADIYIKEYYHDISFHSSVDLYSPETIWQATIPIIVDYKGDIQWIEIRVSGDKNEQSTGTKLVIDEITVYDDDPAWRLLYRENPAHHVDSNILSLRSDNNGDPTGRPTFVVGERYYRARGTSMACPHVAGLAALILSANPEFDQDQVASRLIGSADPIDELNPEWSGKLGSGRINALNAVEGINLHPHLMFESAAGNLFPGSSADLTLVLKNKGKDALDINCVLSSEDPMVTITKDTSNFGDITARDSQDNSLDPFTITLDSSCNLGKPLEFNLRISTPNGYLRETSFTTRAYLPIEDNWPFITSEASAHDSHIVLADIDNNDTEEIIIYTSEQFASGNFMYVFKANGKLYNDNWPLFLENKKIMSVSVGDLDGIGNKDFVLDTGTRLLLDTNADPIGVESIAGGGSCVSLLEDINNDDVLEIIFTKDCGGQYRVCAYDYAGNLIMESDPIECLNGGYFLLSAGDIDKDDFIEIVGTEYETSGTGQRMFIVQHDGSITHISLADTKNLAAPTLADINNDGFLEIIVYGNDINDRAYLFVCNHLGEELWRSCIGNDIISTHHRETTICNIDSDDELEILFYNKDIDYSYKIFAFNHDGSNLGNNWPVSLNAVDESLTVFPIVGDIDGDSDMEVLLTGRIEGQKVINTWNHDGTTLSNWPMYTPKWLDYGSGTRGDIAIGDIDNDGKVELVLFQTYFNMLFDQGISVNVFELGNDIGGVQWPMYRNDPQRTGCYGPVETVQPTAEIIARHIFYNNSVFDNEIYGLDDNNAIAPDKQALLPGETATFANYTSYSRGINSIMIDIENLPVDSLSASDFEFKVGNRTTPDTWPLAPSPSGITVRAGEGRDGSDRVVIIWPDNVIQKQWLKVKVLANDNTGLEEPDIFYFGNAIGESGNSSRDAKVNAYDMLGARDNPHSFFDQALIDDVYDYNRDKRVNVTDMLIVRDNATHYRSMLKLITTPYE